MRRISFMMTLPSVLDGTKTVTRRIGWWSLKPGVQLAACSKSMGFKKGEKAPPPVAYIRVVSVSRERLHAIIGYANPFEELRAEGLGHLTPMEFIEGFCRLNRCKPWSLVNRIEFEYVGEPV